MDETKKYYDVCSAVSAELKRRGLSYTKAAKQLGVSLAAVSNQLSGNKPFGRLAAEKWQTAFGFNPEFLMFGTGSLLNRLGSLPSSSSDVDDSIKADSGYNMLNRPGQKPLIRNFINIIHAGGNYFAIEAFDRLLKGEPQSKIDESISNSMEETQLSKLAEKVLRNHGNSSYDDYVTEYESLHATVEAKILKSMNDGLKETGSSQYSLTGETYK